MGYGSRSSQETKKLSFHYHRGEMEPRTEHRLFYASMTEVFKMAGEGTLTGGAASDESKGFTERLKENAQK